MASAVWQWYTVNSIATKNLGLLKGLGQGVLSIANAIAMQLQWLGDAIQATRSQDVLQAEPDKVVPKIWM